MPFFNVKVYNDEYLRRLATAIDRTDEVAAEQVGEVAFLHATQVMGLLPEELKGKLVVGISDTGDGDYGATITYQMKAAPEGATTQIGQMFIPLDKLGGSSSRRPTVSKYGETGIFVTGIQKTGRPSIESYLMSKTRAAIDEANGVTEQMAAQMVRQELVEWFAANGIIYNAGSERYQASQSVTLPWGEDVPGGRFIVGDF